MPEQSRQPPEAPAEQAVAMPEQSRQPPEAPAEQSPLLNTLAELNKIDLNNIEDRIYRLWKELRLNFDESTDPTITQGMSFFVWSLHNVKRETLRRVLDREHDDVLKSLNSDIRGRLNAAANRWGVSPGVLCALFGPKTISSRACIDLMTALRKSHPNLPFTEFVHTFTGVPAYRLDRWGPRAKKNTLTLLKEAVGKYDAALVQRSVAVPAGPTPPESVATSGRRGHQNGHGTHNDQQDDGVQESPNAENNPFAEPHRPVAQLLAVNAANEIGDASSPRQRSPKGKDPVPVASRETSYLSPEQGRRSRRSSIGYNPSPEPPESLVDDNEPMSTFFDPAPALSDSDDDDSNYFPEPVAFPYVEPRQPRRRLRTDSEEPEDALSTKRRRITRGSGSTGPDSDSEALRLDPSEDPSEGRCAAIRDVDPEANHELASSSAHAEAAGPPLPVTALVQSPSPVSVPLKDASTVVLPYHNTSISEDRRLSVKLPPSTSNSSGIVFGQTIACNTSSLPDIQYRCVLPELLTSAHRLSPGEKLNDVVVNTLLNRLSSRQSRTLAISSILVGSQNVSERTMTRLALSNYDTILFPVCSRDHWCLFVFSRHSHKVELFDSCPGIIPVDNLAKTQILPFLRRMGALNKIDVNLDVSSCPHQQNQVDCGLFTVLFAYQVSAGVQLQGIDVGVRKLEAHRMRFAQCLLMSTHAALTVDEITSLASLVPTGGDPLAALSQYTIQIRQRRNAFSTLSQQQGHFAASMQGLQRLCDEEKLTWQKLFLAAAVSWTHAHHIKHLEDAMQLQNQMAQQKEENARRDRLRKAIDTILEDLSPTGSSLGPHFSNSTGAKTMLNLRCAADLASDVISASPSGQASLSGSQNTGNPFGLCVADILIARFAVGKLQRLKESTSSARGRDQQ